MTRKIKSPGTVSGGGQGQKPKNAKHYSTSQLVMGGAA